MSAGHVLTLEQFDAELAGYPPAFRAEVEAHMDPAITGLLWESVARYAAWRIEDELHDPLREEPRPRSVPPRSRRRSAGTAVSSGSVGGDDPLLELDLAYAVEVLAGVDLSRGGMARCPLPGHDDRTPSFHVSPNGLFYCHGCHRGGDLYSFAAELWEYPVPLRGHAFLEVRRRLLETFAGSELWAA